MFAVGSFFIVRIALPVTCPYRACANYAFSRVVMIWEVIGNALSLLSNYPERYADVIKDACEELRFVFDDKIDYTPKKY